MCYFLYRSFRGQHFFINVQQILRPEITSKVCFYTVCKTYRFQKIKIRNWRNICESRSNSATSMTAVEGIGANSLFQGQEDRFNGITVDSIKEPCAVDTFAKKLELSLSHWREKNFRGIWFKVALEHADWVPILAKNEFQYHHAKSSYVMMYRWLPENEVCNIPPYAHTMIGVGAVVVNDANEVLVVKEKHFVIPHWKLPGGYVEPGEDIGDAAMREVFEETNVKTEFLFMVSFRHTHHGMFRCSDIYFIVGLKPKSEEIKKCDREIAACEWMKIDEFLQHENVIEANRFFLRKYLECLQNGAFVSCSKNIHPLLNKPQCIYSIGIQPNSKS